MIKNGLTLDQSNFLLAVEAGENLTAGNAVYIGSDGKAYKTKADDMTKVDFKGFVRETVSTGVTAYIVHSLHADGFTSLTAGAIYYLSTTAGEITTTATNFKKAVGVAIGTTIIKIIDVPYTRIVKFTSSGTWTKYAGLKEAEIIAIGAGAGGGRWSSSNNDNQAAGGGPGGISIKFVTASDLSSTETITVGTGGNGQTGAPAAGNGGTTSFGSLAIATGGNGADQLVPGSSGIGTTGDVLLQGGHSEPYSSSDSYGGVGILGRGGRNSYSPYGDGGTGGTDSGSATDGNAGQDGIVIVIEKY